MADEKKMASWEDMVSSGVESDLVRLPALSKAKGENFHCKVRGLAPLELIKCYNLPLAEVDALADEDPTGEKLTNVLKEQVQAMDPQELLDTIERVIHAGLVEPKPNSSEKMTERLGEDVMVVFNAITERTVGTREDAADAADFRS